MHKLQVLLLDHVQPFFAFVGILLALQHQHPNSVDFCARLDMARLYSIPSHSAIRVQKQLTEEGQANQIPAAT